MRRDRRIAEVGGPTYDIVNVELPRRDPNSHRGTMLPRGGYEYYVVATRPREQNGLGLSPEEALQDLEDLAALFHVLRDERAVYDHWVELLKIYGVCGKPAHEAQIVAAMKRHGTGHLIVAPSNQIGVIRANLIVTCRR
jgi:hypothetical protein